MAVHGDVVMPLLFVLSSRNSFLSLVSVSREALPRSKVSGSFWVGRRTWRQNDCYPAEPSD
jgi:hypothetical protein